ncbi:MAG: response regulator transcription factor [Patescibacteria group bacterium]|jgi:DNA-binding response OmpR family regulator|nr:response regulator transcription factor [Patescibacteria group bacterium]MDD3778098.1 response regulator transcription factor [Patescibacteria group bacterium]MDD3939056.1 response regulator transcription factor [Patescibacteria group bacterium]MDD4443642.1 response regulator transcription factor [Patescibacteria group bacterium]NCU39288.1 response regulator transcription factor [Candidatus Falkowbacteria bacterium]
MKILLIEDDALIASILKKSLNLKLWLLELATDGEIGLKLALRGTYDLIILDLSLPKKSGQDVIKEIRKRDLKIPIIILSVKSEIRDKKKLFSLGADDYLTKPFICDELIMRIEALLRRPQKIKNKDFRLGPIFFKNQKNIFYYNKKELYLTKKEHNLLLFMLKRKNEIVSKGELLEHVWSYKTNPNSNSIETHIAILRKKLQQKDGSSLIHTFPGRGYRLSLKKISDA